MTGNAVSPITAATLTHRVLVRQLLTMGRAAALGLLGVGVMVVAWAVGVSSTTDLEDGANIVDTLGLAVVIPIVTLVFASAALGDTREDGTLVYLWLRPMDRWPVVVGAMTSAFTVSVPLTVLPVTLAALLTDNGSELVTATAIASLVAVVAYTALFVLLGLLVKNPVVWGLGYILVWEAFAARFGTIPARLAIRGYSRSIITDRVGVELELADLSQASGIVIPLVAAVVAAALATRRLQRLDVA